MDARDRSLSAATDSTILLFWFFVDSHGSRGALLVSTDCQTTGGCTCRTGETCVINEQTNQCSCVGGATN